MNKNDELIIKRVKKYTIDDAGGAWKIALADKMTALMIVFFVLWTTASKSEQELSSLSDYFKGKEIIEKPSLKLLEAAYEDAKEVLKDRRVVMTMDKNTQSITVKFDSEMLFKSGSYVMKQDAVKVLSDFAKVMSEKSEFFYHIYGYTDNVPVKAGSDMKSNLNLSVRRSLAASDVLFESGVDSNRMTVHGEGELNKVSDNDSLDGKSHNRRVEIYVTYSSAPSKIYGEGISFIKSFGDNTVLNDENQSDQTDSQAKASGASSH